MKCKCGHEKEQHCDMWCSGGENCDCKKFEENLCEECGKPYNSEYHMSDECVNISEEDYNKISPDLRKKSFGLGGRQK